MAFNREQIDSTASDFDVNEINQNNFSNNTIFVPIEKSFTLTFDDPVDSETIFGRLYKKAGEYYFEVLQSFNEVIVLTGSELFLPDVRFVRAANNDVITATTGADTRSEIQLADNLTSIEVINNPVVPIPNTGSNIATLYLTPDGTEQVDLDTYFDYNKEYLSYPLTDEAETLYFAIDTDESANTAGAPVAIGLTWEEQ